jgi:hypothetical protein
VTASSRVRNEPGHQELPREEVNVSPPVFEEPTRDPAHPTPAPLSCDGSLYTCPPEPSWI